MKNGMKELCQWIKDKIADGSLANHPTIDDIARMAIACGFDRGAVAQWETAKKFKAIKQEAQS